MPRRKFGREFKIEAVRRVRERGVSVAQAARDHPEQGPRELWCQPPYDREPRRRRPHRLDTLNLTGNAFANTITGNDGANTLDGGGAADTMIGGGGSDTYHVDNAGDRCVEANGGAGTDLVYASVEGRRPCRSDLRGR